MKCKECIELFKCLTCKTKLKWHKCLSCQGCTKCERCAKHANCPNCRRGEKCPNCKGSEEKKETQIQPTQCIQCLSLQMCAECKNCLNCKLCSSCEECGECAKARKDDIIEKCGECHMWREKGIQRFVNMYCVNEQKEICSNCAAKYHKKCSCYDSYDLVVETGKLIDKELDASGSEAVITNKKKEAAITVEQVEKYIGSIEEDKKGFEEKKDEIAAKIISSIKGKYQEVENTYISLKRELEGLRRTIIQTSQNQEERKRKLEETRIAIKQKIGDNDFNDVCNIYKDLKNDNEGGISTLSRNSIQKTCGKVTDFHNNMNMQNLEYNAESICSSSKDKEAKGFQQCKNAVFLLTPYSHTMYTFDVDTQKATLINLVNEKHEEFRMKYNSSTLIYENRIYLIGGTDSLDKCSTNCWVYSFLHNCLRPMQDMQVPRREHSTIIAKGCIYSVGGWTTDGLTNSCEKYYTERVGRDPKEGWTEVRKLNSAKSAISLCTTTTQEELYAIGGLCKDNEAFHFEKLILLADALPDDNTHPQYYWEKVEVKCPDNFMKENPMVGSFAYLKEGIEHLIIFTGGETEDKSIAYDCDLLKKEMAKTLPPKLSGTGSLHGRRPLYTNKGQDIYFVGFYDILHFSSIDQKWVPSIETKKWISYK